MHSKRPTCGTRHDWVLIRGRTCGEETLGGVTRTDLSV